MPTPQHADEDILRLCSEVCEANKEIGRRKLALLTWGNVSAVDRRRGLVAIKPSGVSYEDLTPDRIVIIRLEDGTVVDELPQEKETRSLAEGRVVPGRVLRKRDEGALVDIGYKAEGFVPKEEFSDWENLQEGQEVDVYVELVEDEDNMPLMSVRRAEQQKAYQLLVKGWRPSVDTPTHLELYRHFPAIGAIAHTHSPAATAFAQARRSIPCLGTTHADHFRGAVPVTRMLTAAEVENDYETNIARTIIEVFSRTDPLETPAVLSAGHGPFTWGRTAAEAIRNSVVLEEVARIAFMTLSLASNASPLPSFLSDLHFMRKHGPGAYYGQRPGPDSKPVR